MKENKMGTMPITKLLFTMSGPAILSMLIQGMYNIIDSIFVAQIGQSALAAVTIAFPIQMLIVSFGVGTGVGINSLISRRLGAKRFEDANRATTTGAFIALLNWIPFLIFGVFFSKTFMGLFSDSQYVIEHGGNYLMIVTALCVFCMSGMCIEKIIQSTGNMIFTTISMITGAVTNIILDPILIFGLFGAPKLGMEGAAIATVLAQMLSLCLNIIFLTKKVKTVKIDFTHKVYSLETIKEIYAVGAPSIIMQAVGSIMLFGINSVLAAFSETAVAVMGAYGKLQSFAFMPCFGINQGALPVMGYNYGARNGKRLKKTYLTATTMALIIMTIGFLVFQIFPDKLLILFNANEEMLKLGVPALRIISICFFPAGIGIISAGLFQATGHGMVSLWGSLIRQLVGILPIAIIFGRIFGVTMVWAAFPIAELFGLTYNIVMVIRLYKKELKYLGEE